MFSLIKSIVLRRTFINFVENKRFAGHSKWANIRHTKMAKDQEKSTAIRSCLQKMKVAIAEGNSAKPENNVRLAKLIEQAKKNSLPLTPIKSFLEKMQSSKIQTQSVVFESRGPSGCIVLIHLLTEKVAYSRCMLNNCLKKTAFSAIEIPGDGMYQRKGIILTEKEDRNSDKILDDAIEAGAEDAEIVKENDKEFVQFTTYPSELYKVKHNLEALNYKVFQADLEYIPQVFVTLTDEEMAKVENLFQKLENFEEVVNIYTNIT